MRWLDTTPRRAAPKGHETFILRAASTSSHRLLQRRLLFRAHGAKSRVVKPCCPQVNVNNVVAISGLRSGAVSGGPGRSGRTGQGVPATAGLGEEAEAGPFGELSERVSGVYAEPVREFPAGPVLAGLAGHDAVTWPLLLSGRAWRGPAPTHCWAQCSGPRPRERSPGGAGCCTCWMKRCSDGPGLRRRGVPARGCRRQGTVPGPAHLGPPPPDPVSPAGQALHLADRRDEGAAHHCIVTVTCADGTTLCAPGSQLYGPRNEHTPSGSDPSLGVPLGAGRGQRGVPGNIRPPSRRGLIGPGRAPVCRARGGFCISTSLYRLLCIKVGAHQINRRPSVPGARPRTSQPSGLGTNAQPGRARRASSAVHRHNEQHLRHGHARHQFRVGHLRWSAQPANRIPSEGGYPVGQLQVECGQGPVQVGDHQAFRRSDVYSHINLWTLSAYQSRTTRACRHPYACFRLPVNDLVSVSSAVQS